MGTWINNDGLELRFGLDKTNVDPLGSYTYDGPFRCASIKFAYTQLPTVAQNSVVINDTLTLPKGAVIEKVEVANHIDFTSTGTVNVGLVDTDRVSNASANALVDAITAAELNTGGTNIAGWVGAGVNAAPLTSPKLVTWEQDTAAASTGAGEIRIYYSMP